MSDRIGYSFAFETLEMRPYPVYADRRAHQNSSESVWHKHDFVQIWYCHSGSYFHQIEDRVYECDAGSVVLLPVGTAHKFWVKNEADLMRLDIRMDLLDAENPGLYKNSTVNLFLPEFFDKLKLSFSYYKNLSKDSQLVWEQLFSWFAMLNFAPGNGVTAETIRQKMEELFSIEEYAIGDGCWEKALRLVQTRVCPIFRIVNYLNKHYSQKITDEVLLQEGNISRAVMYRYFKRIMKDTYASFLQFLRTRHAHVCMRQTIYSLTDIAELCGFYDVYHMSRVYSRCYGVTLSKQRNKIERCRKEREEIE